MRHSKSQDSPYGLAKDPSGNLGLLISDLYNMLDKAIMKAVLPHGIAPIEYSLLWHCLEGERTATDLAQILPIDGSRVSRLVTVLVDRGLLRRRRLRSDRRIVMLRLTEEGRELTSSIFQDMRRYYAMLTEDVGEEELRLFESIASRMVANDDAVQGPE